MRSFRSKCLDHCWQTWARIYSCERQFIYQRFFLSGQTS